MASEPTDLGSVVRDTVREALRSWRLPATLTIGLGLGVLEQSFTQRVTGFFFGPFAALFTLFLGPLPWRALLPLEEDGHRGEKLVRAVVAMGVSSALFAVLVTLYRSVATAVHIREVYALGQPREIFIAWLLFLVGGWGLARDIQLEQRLDRTLGSHQRLSAELAAARLDALRADLDPHFLFNALNAIASQCASDPVAAEDNVVRLATLLRAVLDTRRRPLHPLDDELALAADYVALLKARFPALTVVVESDPGLSQVAVPPLLLQPLLENAVRHGRLERGAIEVRVRADGRDLVVTVSSPGPFGGRREGGMGLDLVQRRVALAWGSRAQFDIGSQGERTVGTVVARDAIPPSPTPQVSP